MVDIVYGLDPLVYGEGGLADYPAIPDDALVDGNGDVIGVTSADFSEDHSCYAQKTNLTAEAQAQLLYQFRECPRILGLISSTTNDVQELENVFADLKLAFQLDYAAGAQLLEVAKTVGIFSAGQMNDADFLLYIKAKILADMSSGHGDDFIEAFRILIPGLTTTFSLDEGPGEKAITCEMGGTMFVSTITQRNIFEILRRIVAGGVALWYKFFLQTNNSTVFKCAPALGAVTISATQGLANAAQTTGGHLSGVYGPNHL